MKPMRRRDAHRFWLAVWALTGLALTPAYAETLRAHEIRYHFSFHGLSGGDLELKLIPGKEPQSWVYETHAFPSFLARLVVNDDSLERSWFRVSPTAGVEPERYELDDGTSKHADDVKLTYDYARKRVVGTARGAALDLEMDPGLQDVMTIRLAPVVDLLAGREPHEYAMLDGREVKHYVYTRSGTERLKTEIGELDTVVITSGRKGADGHGRVWRYWYAPSKGWLPVRAEQQEDGKARMVLAVRSLKWLEPAPPPTGDAH